MNKTFYNTQQMQFFSDIPKRNHRIHPRSQFSQEEDDLLAHLVEKYGNENWEEIASNMKNRNVRQCKDRWINYLSPSVKKSPWTPEEDELLENLYLKYGPKWVKIANLIEGRTDINLKNRYLLLQRHKRRKEKLLSKNQEKIKPVIENNCLNVEKKLDEIDDSKEKCLPSFLNNFIEFPLDVFSEWDLFDFE